MAEVPSFPIGGAPSIGSPASPGPSSAVSDLFQHITDIGQEWSHNFNVQAGKDRGAIAQQQAGTEPVLKEGWQALSDYGAAWNNTAGIVYGANKRTEIDTAVASAYEQNYDNPAGMTSAVEGMKSKIFSNVPASMLSTIQDMFQTSSTKGVIGAQHNYDANLHEQGRASATTEIEAANNLITSKIGELGTDEASKDPEVAKAMARVQAIGATATSPNNLLGPLITPSEMATIQGHSKLRIRDAELTHAFNQTSFDQQLGYIDNLITHPDPVLGFQGSIQLARQLKGDYALKKSLMAQDEAGSHQMFQNYLDMAKKNDPSVAFIPPEEAVNRWIKPTASLLQRQMATTDARTAVEIGQQNTAIDKMPFDQQINTARSLDKSSSIPFGGGGSSEDYFRRVAQAESGNSLSQRNPKSTSSGSFGFTDGTYAATVATHPELRGASKNDPRLLAALTNDNAAVLHGALGHDPNYAELYDAHFLGATGAVKFLSADPNTPASQLTTQDVIDKNKQVFTNPDGTQRNVGEVLTDLSKRIGQPDILSAKAGYDIAAAVKSHIMENVKEINIDHGYTYVANRFPNELQDLHLNDQKFDPQQREQNLAQNRAAVEQHTHITPDPVPKGVIDSYNESYKSADTNEAKSQVIARVLHDFPSSNDFVLQRMEISGSDRLAGRAQATGNSQVAQNILSANAKFKDNEDIAKAGKQYSNEQAWQNFNSNFGWMMGPDSTQTIDAFDTYKKLAAQGFAKGETDAYGYARDQLSQVIRQQPINGKATAVTPDISPQNADAITQIIQTIAKNPMPYGLKVGNPTNPMAYATIDQVGDQLRNGDFKPVRQGDHFVLVGKNNETLMTRTPTMDQPLMINFDGSIRNVKSQGAEPTHDQWDGQVISPNPPAQQTREYVPGSSHMATMPVTKPASADQWALDAFQKSKQANLPADTFAYSVSPTNQDRNGLIGVSHVIKDGALPDEAVAYLAKFPAYRDIEQNKAAIKEAWKTPQVRVKQNVNGWYETPLESLADLAATMPHPGYIEYGKYSGAE